MTGGRARRLWIRLGGCVAIAVMLALLAAIGVDAGALSGFEARATDAMFPRGDLGADVVVVAIDAHALAERGGRWPWPRTDQATLVGAIAAGHPKVTVVDELFASSEPGDDALAAELGAAGPVVLAEVAELAGEDHGVLVASAVTPPTDVLADAASVGVATVSPDPNDGVVRMVPVAVSADRVFVPSLALAAVAASDGVDPEVVVRPHGVQVGSRVIPTEGQHRLRISWPEGLTAAGPPVVSAADVMSGRVDASIFADKAVFVGVTDPTLGDSHLVPVARTGGVPGVLVQAAAYNTMMTGAYIAPASTTDTALVVFAVALAVALAVQFLALWAVALVAVAVPVGTLLVASWRADHGTLASVVFPLLAVAVAVMASGGLRYAVETRRRREVARLFAQYVPAPVAAQLMDEGRVAEATAGQRLDVTVLFCDLRGFTAMAAEVAPEEVNARLTAYYEYASAFVLEAGGTLMQYVGDEVYGLFGAPLAADDHANRAVECARSLQVEVDRLDARLRERGAPPLRFGIGLSSGTVVAAHAGSRWRRQYTAVGHAVNVGSRLCSQAGPGEVVLADSVRARLDPAPTLEPMGPLELKGLSEDLVAWRLVLDGQAGSVGCAGTDVQRLRELP